MSKKAAGPALILFNKPFRVLCQFTDKEGRKTLADYIPVGGVYAAGRLDYDSEGLVALTNDGLLQHFIADPENKMAKTYLVQVEGVPEDSALEKLRGGVLLNDGMTRPAAVELVEPRLWPRDPPIRYRREIPTTWLKLGITEGRNRQVRRMTASVGHPALRLVRTQIGPWGLEGLNPGQWRHSPFPSDLLKRRANGQNRSGR